LDAFDRREQGLNLASEIVVELRERQIIGEEADVEGRERSVRPLDLNDRRLGLGRQFAANLIESCGDLGEGRA
jgi:hypothetical protein